MRGRRDEQRELDRRRVGRGQRVVDDLGILFLVEIDGDGAEGARDEQGGHWTVISSVTTCAARSAAATGSSPFARPST